MIADGALNPKHLIDFWFCLPSLPFMRCSQGLQDLQAASVKSFSWFLGGCPKPLKMWVGVEPPRRRRRRKFTTSIQPAKAYEDESVIMSGPH